MDTTESILTSVKKLLGIDESYTHFDADLIMHINSVFSILGQMGVGPKKGFTLTSLTRKLLSLTMASKARSGAFAVSRMRTVA